MTQHLKQQILFIDYYRDPDNRPSQNKKESGKCIVINKRTHQNKRRGQKLLSIKNS